MNRRRFCRGFVLVAFAVGLTLGLTGCFGGDDEEGPTSDTTPAESSTTPTPPAPTPQPQTPVDPVETTVIEIEIPPPLPPPPEAPISVPPPPELPRGPGPLVYTVEQGDTLYSIARKFEVNVDILIETNNIDNPDVIFVDQELVIPPPG